MPLTACSNAAKMSTAVGLDESIEALASGGVAVMDDVTLRTPIVGVKGTPSAMRFTRWQLRNLVAEANAHGDPTKERPPSKRSS
jgi:predicted O-methyltransferase YrrM